MAQRARGQDGIVGRMPEPRGVPILTAPTTRLYPAWREAHREWGPGLHEDGFGLHPDDDVDSPAGFAAWVARLLDQSDPLRPLKPGQASCVYRWIVERDHVLGAIALRHGDTDFVRRMGHIGYGIRPSARGRGLATWALSRMLDEARRVGLERVLVVCEADNIASTKTVEHNGGVLEEPADPGSDGVRRYWIAL